MHRKHVFDLVSLSDGPGICWRLVAVLIRQASSIGSRFVEPYTHDVLRFGKNIESKKNLKVRASKSEDSEWAGMSLQLSYLRCHNLYARDNNFIRHKIILTG